jgi:hypothetical protein
MNDYPKYYLIKQKPLVGKNFVFSLIEFSSPVEENSYMHVAKIIFGDEFREVSEKFYIRYKNIINYKQYPNEVYKKCMKKFDKESA